ncbi:hypothetical protein [Alcaligenes sp. Marseille-Q7550]
MIALQGMQHHARRQLLPLAIGADRLLVDAEQGGAAAGAGDHAMQAQLRQRRGAAEPRGERLRTLALGGRIVEQGDGRAGRQPEIEGECAQGQRDAGLAQAHPQI